MKSLYFCAAILALASADAVRYAPQLKHGWEAAVAPHPEHEVHFMLSLKECPVKLGKLAKLIYAGNQYSQGDLMNMTAPSESALPRVLSFVRAAGITPKVHATGRLVEATASVAKVEKLFNCKIEGVTRKGTKWHRADRVVLPQAIDDVVGGVYGLFGLPLPPKPRHNRTLSEPSWTTTPNVIRKRYSVNVNRGSGSSQVRQAVAEFQGQFSNPADLSSFFQQYVTNAQPGDDQVYAYKGNQGSGYGVEALLDIQYIMGVAPGVKTEFWGYQNDDFCSDLKTFTQAVLADSNPPAVFSISYGYQGSATDLCSSSEINDIDADFQKMAARGITTILASGDSGAGESGVYLYPSWPASSPWVTAVGATGFTDSSLTTEQASVQFGSGSGFSWDFPVADFQKQSIAAYYAYSRSTLPYSFEYNKNGRGTADVSALGENFAVVVQGSTELVGGTSAAAPTFAALVSLINSELVKNGKRPVGFMNSFLYQNPNAFNDVTVGSDKISREGTPLLAGFNCAPGWDPPTGLGTPNFAALLAAYNRK